MGARPTEFGAAEVPGRASDVAQSPQHGLPEAPHHDGALGIVLVGHAANETLGLSLRGLSIFADGGAVMSRILGTVEHHHGLSSPALCVAPISAVGKAAGAPP